MHQYIFRENTSAYASEVKKMSLTVQLILILIIGIGFSATIPLSIITFRDVREILKGGEEDAEPVHQHMSHDL